MSIRVPFDYSIIVPVWNEASTIARAVETLVLFCKRQPQEVEILLVENGSTDETWPIAQALAKNYQNLRALRCPQRGKGAAILYGWKRACAPVVMFLDADLSPSLDVLPSLYASVLKTSGCAVADRLLKASRVRRSLKRELLSRAWTRLASWTLPIPHLDYQCGAKALQTDLVPEIERETESRDWFFDLELLLWLHERGVQIQRVPVAWNESVFSERRSHLPLFRTGVRFLLGLMRLRRRSRLPRS